MMNYLGYLFHLYKGINFSIQEEMSLARAKQRHEKIVSDILVSIFTGRLTAGTKLPTEKKLSEEMKVDRTTLRVALKQLEAMHLLEIRQGDGIYVKDYMKHAGMDFLRALMLSQEEENAQLIIDQFLFDELWEFWMVFLPEVIKVAARKSSPRDLKTLMAMVEQENEQIDNLEKVIEIELSQQDFIARLTNNIVIILLFNSSLPIRKKMLEIIFSAISREELQQHLEVKTILLRDYYSGKSEYNPDVFDKYRQIISGYRDRIIQSFIKNGDG
jgi:GntR family transcriptional repressor for pyruvate dehydrogenase complex